MKLDIFSHEVKSYIASTKGVLSLLENTNLSPEQLDYIKLLKSNNESTLAFLNNNLYSDRIDNSSIDLVEDFFNLHNLIEEITSLYAFQVKQKDIQLEYKIEENVPKILYADEQKIRQILLNLFNNTVRFTTKGLIFLTISMLAEDTDKQNIGIILSDSGPGVAKNVKLFHKYSTTRNGTGLGLYICRKLVELMGGNINYKYDKGATFYFDIWINKNPAQY
ncbi:MAG: sensor histidine kinase [Candidatus Heimdallarchaeota archaeon]